MANIKDISCRKSGFPNYYEILKCERTAATEELKKSYQSLILTTHPDKASCHNDRFPLIQEAWITLRDPESRRIYDAKLTSSEHTESDYLLYDVIHLSDMQISDGVHTYLCRCGSNYVFEESAKDTHEKSVIIDCEECSFSLKVNL